MSHPQANIITTALNLTCTCLVSGLIIASVYYFTHDTAVRKEQEMLTDSMKKLIANANRFDPIKDHSGWFQAYDGDHMAAYIIPAESKGYGGTIKILFAISPTKTVLNYSVLDSKETPGLGDKAGTAMFRDRLIGKDLEHLQVTKDPSDPSHVLAITGATITSRAVTKAAREAVACVNSLTIKGK